MCYTFDMSFRLTQKWKIFGILTVAVLFISTVFVNYVEPKIENWAMSKFPDGFAIMQELQSEYPGKKINVTELTSGAMGEQKATRSLNISVSGNDSLSADEEEKVVQIICAKKAEFKNSYTDFKLQNIKVNRLLVFHVSSARSRSFSCPAS